jgi:hypothetical protein
MIKTQSIWALQKKEKQLKLFTGHNPVRNKFHPLD